MFEAVAMVCALAGAPCRQALLPGYEAATATDCQAALASRPPDPGARFPGLVAGAPVCREAPPGLAFEELAPGLFVHRGHVREPGPGEGADTSNFGFVIGERAVAVIDAGASRAVGEGVWRAIRARTDWPVAEVILTHMHPDHVFGAAVLAEAGARVTGHDGIARAMADRRATWVQTFERALGAEAFLGTDLPPVDREVAEQAEIDLGGRVLVLRAWSEAHTGTDLTVTDSGSGLLFAGDLLFEQHLPVLDGSLTGWQRVLAALADEPVAGVVPGHGGPLLAWPAGAAQEAHYLEVLARDTRAAIARGERMSAAIGGIGVSEAGRWQLFDIYNPRNAAAAFAELEWE